MAEKAKNPQKQDLTLKQEKACRKFIETSNKSAAYRFAYNTTKMKPETINRKAKELFDVGKVSARVDFLRAKIAKRNDITEDSVLQDIIRIGDKAEDADKYGDALKARELLGKHLKLFTDRLEVGGKLTLEEKLQEIKKQR